MEATAKMSIVRTLKKYDSNFAFLGELKESISIVLMQSGMADYLNKAKSCT